MWKCEGIFSLGTEDDFWKERKRVEEKRDGKGVESYSRKSIGLQSDN